MILNGSHLLVCGGFSFHRQMSLGGRADGWMEGGIRKEGVTISSVGFFFFARLFQNGHIIRFIYTIHYAGDHLSDE